MRIKKSTLYSALVLLALIIAAAGYYSYSRGSTAGLTNKLSATTQKVQSAVGDQLKDAAELKATLKPSITNQVKKAAKSVSAKAGAQQPAAAASNSVSTAIQSLISTHPVMVFSKSYCPFCKRAKAVLGSYNLPSEQYRVLEMDQALSPAEMSQYQDELAKITGGMCTV